MCGNFDEESQNETGSNNCERKSRYVCKALIEEHPQQSVLSSSSLSLLRGKVLKEFSTKFEGVFGVKIGKFKM